MRWFWDFLYLITLFPLIADHREPSKEVNQIEQFIRHLLGQHLE